MAVMVGVLPSRCRDALTIGNRGWRGMAPIGRERLAEQLGDRIPQSCSTYWRSALRRCCYSLATAQTLVRALQWG
jgi:hypothetical protein